MVNSNGPSLNKCSIYFELRTKILIPCNQSSFWVIENNNIAFLMTATAPVCIIQSDLVISRSNIEGILPKGPYPPCLRMADRVLLAGYPRNQVALPPLCRIKPTNMEIISDSPLTITMGQRKNVAVYYSDVIMSAMASQITSVSIVCSIICSGANERKHQGSA